VRINLGQDQEMHFVWCPPGTFTMGRRTDELLPEKPGLGETPHHEVTIPNGFYMGAFQVTQAQLSAIVGENPSLFRGDDLPAEKVSFWLALRCAEMLTERFPEHGTFGLPTEPRWEYACRAGTTTPYNTGENETALGWAACFADNSGGRTRPVGRGRPNDFGLYDMHGNVHEWCLNPLEAYTDGSRTDRIDPLWATMQNNRVIRGGSWKSPASQCRSAFRFALPPDEMWDEVGFRLCLDPPASRATEHPPVIVRRGRRSRITRVVKTIAGAWWSLLAR
jgi:formylglycine-generating enzyme required for sulfatase activity